MEKDRKGKRSRMIKKKKKFREVRSSDQEKEKQTEKEGAGQSLNGTVYIVIDSLVVFHA